MKRNGIPLKEIAAEFKKSANYIWHITRDVPSPKTPMQRRVFRGKIKGRIEGSLRIVNVGFTPEQLEKINDLALDAKTSFSKTVSDLIDSALKSMDRD
jgi:hypothetical protein